MSTRLVGRILLLVGVVGIVACFAWWYAYYGGFAKAADAADAAKASTFDFVACFLARPTKCQAVTAWGAFAYQPLVLHLAMVAAYSGMILLASEADSKALLVVDKISAGIGKTFGWTIMILTVGASYEVFVASAPIRNLIGSVPTTWSYDFSYIMYGSLLLMTGAYTLSRNAHVRGDFLYRTWRPRVQAGMDLTIYIVGFLPAILALIYAGYQFAEQSWQFKEKSIFSPAGVPVYPLKTLIPIAAALLLVQGTAEMIRCIICLKTGAWPQRLADIEELETAILHEQQRLQEIEAKK